MKQFADEHLFVDEFDSGKHIPTMRIAADRQAGEEATIVLMAGGFGKRLGDLTRDKPKPLMEIGGKPIVELILNRLSRFGFRKIILTLHYLGDQIREAVGDGSRWNSEISYVEETEPLGTAGSLGLLPDLQKGPVIVSNADLLTTIDYGELLAHHKAQNADMTVCVIDHSIVLPFGHVIMKDGMVERIDEKPTINFPVSGGMYVLNDNVISRHVGRNERLDMPQLFERVVNNGGRVSAYHIDGFWMDIGRVHDLDEARRQMHGQLARDFDAGTDS